MLVSTEVRGRIRRGHRCDRAMMLRCVYIITGINRAFRFITAVFVFGFTAGRFKRTYCHFRFSKLNRVPIVFLSWLIVRFL